MSGVQFTLRANYEDEWGFYLLREELRSACEAQVFPIHITHQNGELRITASTTFYDISISPEIEYMASASPVQLFSQVVEMEFSQNEVDLNEFNSGNLIISARIDQTGMKKLVSFLHKMLEVCSMGPWVPKHVNVTWVNERVIEGYVLLL